MTSGFLKAENNKTAYLILLSILMSNFVLAQDYIPQDLFYIERNKNSNIVQYAIHVDTQSCQLADKDPVHVFWRNKEVSPTDISDLIFYELPAYGIKSQIQNDKILQVSLKALPNKLINIEISKINDSCEVTPYVYVEKAKLKLEQIYVFAKENPFWLPTVEWIEIRGKDKNGYAMKERIIPD